MCIDTFRQPRMYACASKDGRRPPEWRSRTARTHAHTHGMGPGELTEAQRALEAAMVKNEDQKVPQHVATPSASPI